MHEQELLQVKDRVNRSIPALGWRAVDPTGFGMVSVADQELLGCSRDLERSYLLDNEKYYTDRIYIDGPKDEGRSMDGGISHRIGFSISSPNVMQIRQTYSNIKSKDQDLIEIRLDALIPKDTPESRARVGVYLVQLSSFCRNGSMVSLPSGRTRGFVDQAVFPDSYRYELLEGISKQGYSWLELDDDIPDDIFNSISDEASKHGTKIMLSCYIDDKMEWDVPSREKIERSGGVMVFIKVDSGPSFRRLIRTASLLGSVAGSRSKVIRILPGSFPISGHILGLLGLDLSFIEVSRDEIAGGGVPTPGSSLYDFFLRCGINRELWSKEWSLNDRKIDLNTDLLVHIGNPMDNDISLKINNMVARRMSLDRMMIPYQCTHENLQSMMGQFRTMGIKGLFIDIPFRSSMVSKLDWCDPRSKLSGGVNIVSCSDGKLNGYNTEVYAVSDCLASSGLMKGGSNLLVLGTGLSGRSAALGSSILGINTYIAGPNLERVKRVSREMGNGMKGISFNGLKKFKVNFDAVINSIPFNEGPSSSPHTSPEELVRTIEPQLGLDICRSYQWTPFLSSIESRGGRPIQGSEVLVSSTIRDNKIWDGTIVNEEMIKDILLSLM
ncbi:MAG: hypothetical protein U9R75_07210 [Candidatus Thermoplasmatota archaeon]|nr:hypothetical protein [Candidatus Thermoplasmatota archaeon]